MAEEQHEATAPHELVSVEMLDVGEKVFVEAWKTGADQRACLLAAYVAMTERGEQELEAWLQQQPIDPDEVELDADPNEVHGA